MVLVSTRRYSFSVVVKSTVLDAMKEVPGKLGTMDHAKACQEVLKGLIVLNQVYVRKARFSTELSSFC